MTSNIAIPYNSLLIEFEACFTRSVSDPKPLDVPYKDVIGLVRDVFSNALKNKESRVIFEIKLDHYLDQYINKSEDKKSKVAVKLARIALYQVLNNLILAKMPEDIQSRIFTHINSNSTINAVRLVCKSFCKAVDGNPPTKFNLCRTSGLLAIELKALSFSKNDFDRVSLNINCKSALCSLREALKQYATNGELKTKLTNESSVVEKVFQLAINENNEYGIKQTCAHLERFRNCFIAKRGPQITEFILCINKILAFLKTLPLDA